MNSDAKSNLFMAEGHPDENQLLLAMERELTPDETTEVEQHLGNCWSCRARADEMQRGILAFVEYREKRFLPSLPSAPDEFRNFPNRLRGAAGSERGTGWLKKITRRLAEHFVFAGQIKWASLVAVATAGVVLYVQVIRPPVVSADEILTRAASAQNPPSVPGKTKIIRIARQKVEIRSGNRWTTRTFAWTVGSSTGLARWAPQADLLQWNIPFTVEAFADWRRSLPNKQDKVKRSGNLLTLDTMAANSWLKEASIAVRADDFHPVEEYLHFGDDRELTIKELNFEIQEQAPIGNSIAPQEIGAGPKIAKSEPVDPSAPATNLDEVELELRYTLYMNQWDLGEDLIIGTNSGKVTLSGTVSSDERARSMHATLGGLPNVQLSITSPHAGAAQNRPRKRASPENLQALPPAPLLKEAFDQAFASLEERLSFVDQCLDASDRALSHAFAIKGLVNRYDERAVQLLKPASQQKLHEMLTGHLEQLRRANGGLDRLLKFLPAASSGLPPAIPPEWRLSVRLLFMEVQGEDHAITRLVVGSHTDDKDLVKTAHEFRSDHETIDLLLANLSHADFDRILQ